MTTGTPMPGDQNNWFDYWHREEQKQATRAQTPLTEKVLDIIGWQGRLKIALDDVTDRFLPCAEGELECCELCSNCSVAIELENDLRMIIRRVSQLERAAVPLPDQADVRAHLRDHYSRIGHERLGIAYRPNEAPRFA